MPDKHTVKALLFDVFGTVVDWRSGIIRDLQAWGETEGLTANWAEVADAWRGLYEPAMERVRSGDRGFLRLDILHKENLVDVCGQFGLPEPAGASLQELVTAWHRLDPWPDAVQGLERLKTRFIIAPCSNGNIALITNMAKRAGLPWDVVLGAEVAQAYKPAPRAYLGSADAIGLKPEECMMVAAHEADLEAAADVGLVTAYVHRPDEFGPGNSVKMPAADAWSYVVSDLNELADQLDC